MNNKIIAIVGMCGSGKSVASDILVDMGYEKIYFGGVTMDKLKEEGLEVTPDNERTMRERLRKQYGMGAYATILLPKIKELSNTKGDFATYIAVSERIRALEEILQESEDK